MHYNTKNTDKENGWIRLKVIKTAKKLGASLIGFAPVSRGDDFKEVPEDYRPKNVWSGTETVVVLVCRYFCRLSKVRLLLTIKSSIILPTSFLIKQSIDLLFLSVEPKFSRNFK